MNTKFNTKLALITVSSLLVLTSCIWWNKNNEKATETENVNTEESITSFEQRRLSYDMEEYKEIRKTWFIMINWQKVAITDKTSDQDIQYYLERSQATWEWIWVVLSKEEYKKWYNELLWRKSENDPNLSFSEIETIVLNTWKEAMKHENPKIREHYYKRFKDFENWLKDKDPEVVKAVQEYKVSYEKQKELEAKQNESSKQR